MSGWSHFEGWDKMTFMTLLPTLTGNYQIGTLTIHCVNDNPEGCITPLEFIEGSELYDIGGFVIQANWDDGTFTCPPQAQPPVSYQNGPYTGTRKELR